MQFDHLAEAYFDGFDPDLADHKLGYLMALDLDLSMCSAPSCLTHIIKIPIVTNVSLQM